MESPTRCPPRATLCTAILVCITGIAAPRADEKSWVTDHSFADFSGGSLSAGGANLYVARSGQIEMINRLDFNNDGHLDLFVANDHNHLEGADLLIYRGRPQGPRSLLPPLADQLPQQKLLDEIRRRQDAAIRLPSDGGGRVTVADLNNDGRAEIICCNFKHNYTIYSNAVIYWNGERGFDAQRRTELPTLLAGGVAAADFNQDGFVDLAFANRGNFEHLALVEPFGHLESYVYWNGPTGFDAERKTVLPTATAVDCAAGDLNGDGFPELLFANHNRQENNLFLYWGSAEGFSADRRLVRPVSQPVGLQLADLNRDRRLDLIVLEKADRALLFRGTEHGLEEAPWTSLATRGARRVAVGDLNADTIPELVFANASADDPQVSFLYWGTAQGYSEQRRTELPTLRASDVVLADFNRDSRLDIGFSNTSNGTTHDVNSYLYWNRSNGFHKADRSEVLGFSPSSAAAADLDRDGHQDLVLASHVSGRSGAIDSLIYWGNPVHRYSTSSVTRLPNCSGLGLADLNQDGYVDVVGGSQGVIYWGGEEGFNAQRIDPNDRLNGNSVAIADLNRDGFLDLVIPEGFRPRFPEPGEKVTPTTGRVLWGSQDGFSTAHQLVLTLQTHFSQSVNIADLNNDGFLDLIFPGLETGKTQIFFGGADGRYTDERTTTFMAHNASTIEIADLNRDGWLDLIFGGGWDIHNRAKPTRHAMILWGGPEGYARERGLRLEAFDALEAAVADLNRDGHLDIVFSNYHAYFTRRIPALIYWGGVDGSYSESRRTALPAESSSALSVADYNRDGWLDLFICNHVIEGDHSVGSHIHWGGPQGFSAKRRQWLPTFGPHFGIGRDLGNLYDRRLREEYTSRSLQIPDGQIPTQLAWQARTPHGTAVQLQIRTAPSRESLRGATWVGPEGPASLFREPGRIPPPPLDHRWLQYRARLTTPDGGSTPVLESVTLMVADR